MQLRPHQAAAIDGLRASLAKGKRRPMLQLPTGAGKTFIAARIIDAALARKKRVMFVVDAVSLVDQTVERFFEAGIHDIGVIQADHLMTDYSKPVQVVSVQTLRNRKMPRADLVIVDEAHRMYEFVRDWMASEEWAKVPFLGLSATPWSKGLGMIYDDLIMPVTMAELIDQGYLCPFRAYAPATPDLSKVKTVRGDYQEKQLAEVMGDDKLVADVVGTWLERGEDRPTLCFGVDRAHAQKLQERFISAGVPAGYIDANTPPIERQKIERQLDRGDIRVVCNVGCLTTGVDWSVGCIILARPTQSEILYVQMVGRGLRVNPPMPDCIILDHAGNCLRLGMVTEIVRNKLCTRKPGEKAVAERKPALPKECSRCSYLMPVGVVICPGCGHERKRVSDIEEAAGELVQVSGKKGKAKAEATKKEKQRWYSAFIWYARHKQYKDGWVNHKYKEKFGVWPVGLDRVEKAPAADIQGWIRSKQIARAKAMKKADEKASAA